MFEQSELLTQFYREYLEWVENGGCQILGEFEFARNTGLCQNLEDWCRFNSFEREKRHALENELDKQFCLAFPKKINKWGLCGLIFNIDPEDYIAECLLAQCHLNHARIQWVRDHAIPQS